MASDWLMSPGRPNHKGGMWWNLLLFLANLVSASHRLSYVILASYWLSSVTLASHRLSYVILASHWLSSVTLASHWLIVTQAQTNCIQGSLFYRKFRIKKEYLTLFSFPDGFSGMGFSLRFPRQILYNPTVSLQSIPSWFWLHLQFTGDSGL